MQEISIFVLFKIALRRAWALILAFVIAAAAAFCYCEFVATPVYGANASIIVTNGAVVNSEETSSANNKVLGSDIQASLMLVDSVVDMLKTPDIYKYLARKLGSEYDYKALKACTTIARRGEDTLFIDISYKDNDPQRAIKVTNVFASAACDYVAEFINRTDPKIVSSADRANLVAPRTIKSTLLYGFGAAFILYLIFVFFELFNNKIKGEEDFTSRYNIPLLGSIPDFDEARKASAYKKGGYYK
ncbi:MAG: hypothetical protein J5659_01225 [Clostridia bacterium]|nr:hypothetical protein [Clostridia bacterium]